MKNSQLNFSDKRILTALRIHGFEKVLTEVFGTMGPKRKEAIAVGGRDAYAKAIQNLKHPLTPRRT